MERLAKFIRSVVPADPAQLLILAGAVCLTVSPHLRFWPTDSIGSPNRRVEPSIELTAALGVLSLCVVLFSGMAAYFICFWPGKHPIRRILLRVFAPAVIGASFFPAQVLWRGQPPSSVLQSTSHLAESIRSFDWSRWVSLPGVFFCLAGLLLIAIYSSRLAFGIARLPLSFSGDLSSRPADSASWLRLQWLIWVLVGPLIFVAGLTGLVTFVLPSVLTSRMSVGAKTILIDRLSPVLAVLAALALLLWIMGEENRHLTWGVARLPKLRFAALGLSFPFAIASLISIGQYMLARTQWAAHDFGRAVSPGFASFFKLPDPWLCLLIFSALFEELIFRGLLQRHFIQRYGIYRGIFLVGIVWAAFHFHSDLAFSQSGRQQVVTIIGSRVVVCLVLSYVLGWLTLRFSSVIPAALAHAFYNVLVFSEFSPTFPGKAALRLGVWAVLAWILFRYWPIHIEQPLDSENMLSECPSTRFSNLNS